MNLQQLADRDAWTCWLCGNAVDPRAVLGSAHAASVDHVVPRAAGGKTTDDNLRLAHRRCNSKRGSAIPELRWPSYPSMVDATDLWPVVKRLLKRRGSPESVAFFADHQDAEDAAAWVVSIATTVSGEPWEAEVISTGAVEAVRLRAT